MTLTQPFEYRHGELFCEAVPLLQIARQAGTPCYVYSQAAIIQNYRHFYSTFAAVAPLICYAVKANSNLSILRLLRDERSGFDVVSGGELYRLKRIHADLRKTVFSGVGKTRQELKMAIEHELLAINVESLEELEVLASLGGRREEPTAVSFRINPDVNAATHPYIATGLRQHKFGIDLGQIPDLIEFLRHHPKLRAVGLGFHIGSQILDVQPFLDSFLKLKELAEEFRSHGFPVEHLDVGGGIGIPYQDEDPADLVRYARFLEEQRSDYRIVLEPGRFIVGNTGVLLNQVLYHKVNHGKRFVVVDGAMNDLIRPSLYQSYHQILPLEHRENCLMADVVGPVCETGDFFARDRWLPSLQKGDYLAVMNAGAYGFPLSSNYNSRPRVAEVLVDADRVAIIRKRETYEDLIHGETASIARAFSRKSKHWV